MKLLAKDHILEKRYMDTLNLQKDCESELHFTDKIEYVQD